MFTIATWNINSLNVRLPQLLDWLQANPVDAIGLQELKLTDDKFPFMELEAAGYQAVCHGQKTYNGVAILSRLPITDAGDRDHAGLVGPGGGRDQSDPGDQHRQRHARHHPGHRQCRAGRAAHHHPHRRQDPGRAPDPQLR